MNRRNTNMTNSIAGSVPYVPTMGVQVAYSTGLRHPREVTRGKDHDPQVNNRTGVVFNEFNFWDAAARTAFNTKQEARALRGGAQGELDFVTDPRRDVSGMSAEEISAERQECQRELDNRIEAEKQAKIQHDAIKAKASERNGWLRRIYDAIDAAPLPIKTVKPKRLKGNLIELRAAKKEEIARVSKAPITEEEATAIAIANLPQPAAVTVGAGGAIHIPMTRVAAEPVGGTVPAAPDLLRWLMRFHRDAIESDVRASMAAKYKGVDLAMSDRDKRLRMRQLKEELLEIDRALCEAAWDAYAANPADGLHLPPGASGAAMLGIESSMPLRDDED
jgi:hypothetical protein